MKKNILNIILTLFTIIIIVSCNDSYLNQIPESEITEANFFKTATDLELYSNQFYDKYYDNALMLTNWSECPSDNICTQSMTSAVELYSIMSGATVPNNASQWDWTAIRNTNFMITRMNRATGSNVNHYKGFARLHRANLYYFEKVLRYSDVPWYNKDLMTNDEKLLYKPQDSRMLVVDSVFADYDYAINNMNRGGNRTLLTKEAALAFKARAAVIEGAWRKYHSELKLNDAEKYYNMAINACEQLMDSGLFSISDSYEGLFRNSDLGNNPEIIFYRDFNRNLAKGWSNTIWSYSGGGFSRDLEETYLYVKDGKAVPFTSIEGYDKMGCNEVYNNRDPRMKQTMWYPGVIRYGYGLAVPDLQTGGFSNKKFEGLSDGSNQTGFGSSALCYGDKEILRYGEILLIYAEAKAELGMLTQTDIDKTINVLRDRVNMPHASLTEWLNNIDPVLEAKYPNVNSSQKGAILEVRRERRVELAGEGLRYADMMRWGIGSEFNIIQEGMYFPSLGVYDLTNNGIPDVVIVKSLDDKDNYKYAYEQNANCITLVLGAGNDNVILTNGDSGFLKPAFEDGLFIFTSPKDYYYPISTHDMTINPNLVQNPNWN